MSTPIRIVAFDGEELVAAIRREAADSEGWVHATGQVEQAELKLAGQGADRRRSVNARATLASFGGPVGGPYGATLVRESHAGLELHAGILLSARCLGVTAAIFPAELSESLRAGRSATKTGSSEEDVEQLLPDAGDLVHHFAFGLCEVLMASGDRLKIRDLGEPGRVREISIERLKVEGPTEERGKRLFTLVRKT